MVEEGVGNEEGVGTGERVAQRKVTYANEQLRRIVQAEDNGEAFIESSLQDSSQ